MAEADSNIGRNWIDVIKPESTSGNRINLITYSMVISLDSKGVLFNTRLDKRVRKNRFKIVTRREETLRSRVDN